MSENPRDQSATARFIRASGQVQDKSLWWPARIVVQLVQYMIAILIVTIANAFKAIISGKGSHKREH